MESGEKSITTRKLLPTWFDRNASPMIVTLVAFFHFAVIKNQTLTPSVAFTSVRITFNRRRSLTDETYNYRSLVSVVHDVYEFDVDWISPVFSEMKFALNALPETLINMLQVLSPMTSYRLVALIFSCSPLFLSDVLKSIFMRQRLLLSHHSAETLLPSLSMVPQSRGHRTVDALALPRRVQCPACHPHQRQSSC